MKFTMTNLYPQHSFIISVNKQDILKSFGFEFAFIIGHTFWQVIMIVDSISVVPIWADAEGRFGGIFYEYEVSKGFRFTINWNYGQRFVIMMVYNKDRGLPVLPSAEK